jgi:HlyD family secretion protein
LNGKNNEETAVRNNNYDLRNTRYELKHLFPDIRHSYFAISNCLLLFTVLLFNTSCSFIRDIAGLQPSEARVPTAKVVRGPVETKIYTLGELRPAQTATIVAPPMSGQLQIIHLLKTGTRVKQGEVVVEFDPSEQEYNLEQSRSQLEEADEQIIKLKADQAVKAAQNRVALLKAQYNVRRAELKVKGNDLLSTIEAKKNLIDLADAKRRYEQLQRDIQSRASSDAADMAVQNVARMRAQMGMKVAQQNIDNLTWKTPSDGVVVVGQNLEALMSASGSIRITSTTDIPEFREGDQAYPGRLVAQIQDTGDLEISSKVLETDRGNLEPGQPIEVWLDSAPLKAYTGRIKSIATSATAASSASTTTDLLESLSTRSFDAIFQVNGKGDQLCMGVSARVLIKGKSTPDALSIPRQALFQRDGKQVVYSQRGEAWESREVRVRYFTESRAVVDGLSENTLVALVDPDLQKSKAAAQKSSLASILGGPAK